jgi:hypothetical protein
MKTLKTFLGLGVALVLALLAWTGCESTGGSVSGGMYYGTGFYDPWYYGGYYGGGGIIVTPPPPSRPDRPVRPEHPIYRPPAPRPTPMPSIPSAPRPSSRR